MAATAAVVNADVAVLASALPARSLTPLAPPVTEIVYVFEFASAALGVSVAVFVPALYVTVAATGVAPSSKRMVAAVDRRGVHRFAERDRHRDARGDACRAASAG